MKYTLEELIAELQVREISSVKNVLVKIVEVINNQNSSASDLKRLIESDPPLATRVMRRANSAYYGMSRRMEDILDAIVCIGFEAVRELSLSQKVCELFSNDEIVNGYSRQELWKHCVSVATCGKLIFRHEMRRIGEDIYTAGLLHDIGIIVEDQFMHDEFMQIMQSMEHEGKDLMDEERDVLGYTHADIGRGLADAWDFPAVLCEVLGSDGLPVWKQDDAALIASTLYVANTACMQRGIGFKEVCRIDERAYDDCLRKLNLSRRGMNLIMQEVEDNIQEMAQDGWF